MTASPALLKAMLRARRFDEALLANAHEIRGHYHVSIGLEATAAALAAVRRPDDLVSTTYRNHAQLAALGSDLAAMFAEVFGRDLGPQRGRAGSIHLADPQVGILHTSAMVSGGVPLALGLAYAARRRNPYAVCFCFFGDGAFGEGAVHESLNLAALWKLPVVFVCENNAVPAECRATAALTAPSLLAIAEVYGILGSEVDGGDAAAVTAALGGLTDEARRRRGPAFLDARSVPWPGNATFMPHDATGPTDLADATTDRATDPWSARHDPVLRECRRLLAAGVALDDLRRIGDAVTAEVEQALTAAREAAPAPASAATTDVVGA
ncbi:MAG: thiamine pyrophosphate-dependent dehydrogenase E1 component subunit alpha [Acidimicrobiia bacterium]